MPGHSQVQVATGIHGYSLTLYESSKIYISPVPTPISADEDDEETANEEDDEQFAD